MAFRILFKKGDTDCCRVEIEEVKAEAACCAGEKDGRDEACCAGKVEEKK